MTSYALADGWTEGHVRDVASAIIHRNAELGALVGTIGLTASLWPAHMAQARAGTPPKMVPATAGIAIGGRRELGSTEAAKAALELLTALARACGITQVEGGEGEEPRLSLTVAWRRPSDQQEAETMRAIVAMREAREDEILTDFVTKWIKAA